MDYDTYSANDQIGKVCISLNPLLLSNSDKSGFATHTGKGSVMSGWLPVYDTSKLSYPFRNNGNKERKSAQNKRKKRNEQKTAEISEFYSFFNY
jgi:hypothetical protein